MSAEAEPLHTALIDGLKARGLLAGPRIEAAFRAVPRHLFLPGRDLVEVYTDQAIPTHRDADGFGTSSSSQPAIMAVMLAQLSPQPGERILEIGAGTGYNAALIAQLVGAEGRVVTVDLDETVAAEARANLARAGVEGVEVVAADGGLGWPPGAPYDRIIVTCGPADLPPAWWDQLRPGGRLVVPLTLAPGVARSCAFDLEAGVLIARSLEPCGFMPLRGQFGGDPFARIALAEGVLLELMPDPGADPEAVRTWLARRPRVHRLPLEPGMRDLIFGDVRVRLGLDHPSTAVLHVQGPAAGDRRWPLLQRQVEASGGWGTTFGCASASGVALLGWTPRPSTRLAVHGYGPDVEPHRRLVAMVERWLESESAPTAGLSLRAYRSGSDPMLNEGERRLERRSCTLVLGFDAPARRA